MAPEAPTEGPVETPRLAPIAYRGAARVVDLFFVSLGFIAIGSIVARRAEPSPFLADLIVYGVAGLYEVALTAFRGQTLGKMILQLRVVRLPDLGRPGLGRSFIRWLVPAGASYVLGTVPIPLGYVAGLLVPLIFLYAFIDPRKQGLHDKAAGTIVTTERRPF